MTVCALMDDDKIPERVCTGCGRPLCKKQTFLDGTANTVEQQVNRRIEEMSTQSHSEERARLLDLCRIYRVISGEDQRWTELPADVAADLVKREMQGRVGVSADSVNREARRKWVIQYQSHKHAGMHCVESLGSGVGVPWDHVRAAVDAAACRILQPALRVTHGHDEYGFCSECDPDRWKEFVARKKTAKKTL